MIGTVGILLKAKQAGFLPTIRDDLMKLRENGFSISQPVIDAVLEQANEK
jgi:predicted nucleic acid-binding protein